MYTWNVLMEKEKNLIRKIGIIFQKKNSVIMFLPDDLVVG